MSSAHHPEKACIEWKNTSLHRGRNTSSKHPFFEKGIMEIGKLNIVLLGLIVVILIGLISQDESSTPLSTQEVRVQSVTTPELAALDAQDEPTPVTVEQAEPPKPESKAPQKTHKKHEKTASAVQQSKQTELVAASQSTQLEPTSENNTKENEHPEQTGPSRNILVFNLWSVSELRLRSAFTKLINDGSAPAAIVDTRKKEYLAFVNKRTHKCGELHNKFASNINTVEKLTFKEKDVEVLECHTTENVTEINRLNE
jgi:cytoskeletal protein RodZ